MPPIAPPRKPKKSPNMTKSISQKDIRVIDSPVNVHNVSQDSGISRSPAQFSNNSSVSLNAVCMANSSMERVTTRLTPSSLPSSGASSSVDAIPPSKSKWRLGDFFKRRSDSPDPKSRRLGAIPSWKEKIEDTKFKVEVQRSYLGNNAASTSSEEEEDDGIIIEDYEKEPESMMRTSSVGSLSSSRYQGHPHEPYRRIRDSHQQPPPPPPRDPKRKLYLLNSSTRPISYSFENISSTVRDPEDLGLPPVWNNRPQRLIYSPPSHAYVSPSSSHYVRNKPIESPPPPLPPRKEELGTISDESQAAMASANEFWKSPPFPFVPSNPPSDLRRTESPNTLPSAKDIRRRRTASSTTSEDCLIMNRGGSSSVKNGKLSPSSSISSKDSGCSEVGSKSVVPMSVLDENLEDKKTTYILSSSPPRSGDQDPGFSTKHRRSLFRDALFELEAVFDDIQKDEALLDRAERRDLPTAHQELIFRSRREQSSTSNTGTHSDETAFSDMDNFMNWNTSSSFENLSPVRARTPGYRRSGVIDKKTDDMAYRKARDNNKLPNTETGKSEQSYLLLSSSLALSPKGSLMQIDRESGTDEPDTLFDDVLFRNIRDANSNVQSDPQPKFGIPIGPVSGASETDYLHAVPEGKYRSTFHAMRNPDLVLDDLALRRLRKDGNLSDPNHLGIVKDPNSNITYHSCWKHKMLERQKSVPADDVFYPDKNNPIMVALSKDIAEIIKKQSGIASAGDEEEIVTYDQLQLTGLDTSRPAILEAVKQRNERNPEWSGQTVYSLLSGEGTAIGDTRDIQEQLQDVVDTIDRDLKLCQKTREVDVDAVEGSEIVKKSPEDVEEEENSVVEPVPLFNNSETESSSLSKMSSIHEDKDPIVSNDFLEVLPASSSFHSVPKPSRRLRRRHSSSSSKAKPEDLIPSGSCPSVAFLPRMPSEKCDSVRRMGKLERRGGGGGGATASGRRLMSSQQQQQQQPSSSSSDEESSSMIQHESYSRYRRRKKRKTHGGSSSERSSSSISNRRRVNKSPEHIYHTIDSVIVGGTRSKSSESSPFQDANVLNQSTSSLKVRHSRASLSPTETEAMMKRKSLLNTSYSSEEILIQAVNSLHGLGDELKASVSSSSSSPHTPQSTLGTSATTSKTLSSPDIVKSLSKTLTPPISPHHRPAPPSIANETVKTELISDPLLEHWPGRPKKSLGDGSKKLSENMRAASGSTPPTTSPSTASKPPIFPLLNNGSSSSTSGAAALKLVSLRKPSESFLSRRTAESSSLNDNSTPQFVKEFRRRSGGFNPNEVILSPPLAAPPRPQSAVIIRKDNFVHKIESMKSDNIESSSTAHVKFNEQEVLKTCEDFIKDYDLRRQSTPPVPMPRESLLKKKSNTEESCSPKGMRNRSSSLTIHDKRSPPNVYDCENMLPKPILKKSSEDLLKDSSGVVSGILKRKSSEYEHIRIRTPSPESDIRPILRSRNSSVGEDLSSPHSILKRSLDDESYEPCSSSENISPQGILKRRSSSAGIIGSSSLEGLTDYPDSSRPSILKKQGSMEELLDVKSILKKKGMSTDEELDEEFTRSQCHTPKSILKSRKSEESLSPIGEPSDNYNRRVSLEHTEDHTTGIRPILKRKESREELLLAVSHRLSERSFHSPDVEHKSILVRPRPSSLGSPREEPVLELSYRSESSHHTNHLNRLRRAESENVSSSPPRSSVYVSLSESRKAATSANPKRSSSLRSVNDYDLNKEDELNKVEKEETRESNIKKGPLLPPLSNKRSKRDISRRFITQPITIDEVQMAAQMRNQILNGLGGGCLSFGGAVIFGSKDSSINEQGSGKRRSSNIASEISGSNCSNGVSSVLKKEEPSGILKRRSSRKEYEFEASNEIPSSISQSAPSSANSTPRKSILKHDSMDNNNTSGGGGSSLHGSSISHPASLHISHHPEEPSSCISKKLKGVLKKDSSYEETLKPILKNISNPGGEDNHSSLGDLDLSLSSCSSEDIVRTFNDVIIDPIPAASSLDRGEEEEFEDEEVEKEEYEGEEQPRSMKPLPSEPVIPPSSVNISADGDLASKLQQLAVKAEAIKQQKLLQEEQSKEHQRVDILSSLNSDDHGGEAGLRISVRSTSKDTLCEASSSSSRTSISKTGGSLPFNAKTPPINKCVKKSASFRESSYSRASSISPQSCGSHRSLTTDVSADEYYQIFKQTKRLPPEDVSKMREIVEKENSVPKRPKPEIKINGGGIADRLAALKKNGEEGWKKKVQKMDVIENINHVPSNKQDFRPSSLTDRVSQLQSSQNNWQCKVGEKDAKKFTVAGKMSRFGVSNYNSSGDSGDEERIRSTPKLRSFGSPRPRSTCIMDDTKISSSLTRKLSTPVSRSKSSIESRRVVQVPSTIDDDFTNFYGKVEDVLAPSSESAPTVETDLDEMLGEFKPLAAVKKTRGPLNKRKPTSGNPIKKLAARKDIQQNYTEHLKVATQTPSKGSKHAHLAAEALAGLASKEDFSSVQLKRGNTAVPNQDMIPYKELMLLQVKGRRHCQTRLVEPKASSINSGDCYVLVTPNEVFNWIGRFSNVIERARSAEVALHIQQTHDLGFKSSSKVITVEDPSYNRKFWGILLEEEEDETNAKPSEAGPSDEDELYEIKVNEFNLVWEVSEVDGTLTPVQEFWGTVPRYSLLHPDKVLVLDFGSELYLWSGKTAGFEVRKAGAQSIKELWETGYEFEEGAVNPVLGENIPPKAFERPAWCILGRVNSHMETVLFREKFQDWPQDESSRIIKSKEDEKLKRLIQNNSPSNIVDYAERSIFDIESYDAHDLAAFPLEDPDMELENSHLGRGTSFYDSGERRHYEIETLDIVVWYVQEYDVTPLNLDEWKAQFHFEDAYIVRWKYKVSLTGRDLKGNPSKHSAVGRERVAFFFWQGLESKINEKGASALKTVELDRERGPQIRVDQGKEEAAFLNLWQGEMMIHFGKRNKSNDYDEHRLYVVRGVVPQETHLVEVECSARSLRSLGTFVLFSPKSSRIHIWHGQYSPPTSRELARAFVSRFKDNPSQELGFNEGKMIVVTEESHDGNGISSGPISEAVGSSTHLPFSLSQGLSQSPRLYRMTSVSGRFLVNEVLCPHRKIDTLYPMPFNQGDLYISEQPALFLLDVGKKLWLWQGWWPESEGGFNGYKDGSVRWHAERRAAMQTAVDLWKISRRNSECLAELVWAGFESTEFQNLFPSWRHHEDAKVLNQSFVGNSDLKSVLSSLSRMEYSWEDLCKRPLPDGVDPSKLEKYLNDQEFEAHLGLSKEDFQSAPKWKQIEIRKEKGLF